MQLRVILAVLVAQAHGAGFMVSKIGGDSAGPTTASPSAIYWNPAAIARLPGTRIYLDNNLLWREASFTRDTTHTDPDGRRYAPVELTTMSSQPMFAATSDLGTDALTVGLGIYAPFGSSVSWANRDGPQRFESIYGRLHGVYVTPAVTWTLVEGLHVSVAPSYVNLLVQSYRARDLAQAVEARTGTEIASEQPENEGRVYLDFDGHGFAYAVGLLWEVGDLVLGGAYNSAIDVELDGTLSVFLPRNAFYQSLTEGDVEVPATLRTTWPGAVRAGAEWRAAERITFTLKLEWVRWSTYDEVELDVEPAHVAGLGDLDTTQTTGWRDAANIRLGGRYALSPGFVLFGGVGAENGAIPEARRTPAFFDAAKAGVGIGAMWRPTPAVEVNVGYTHVQSLDTEVRESAGTLSHAGTYRQRAEILNTNVSWRIGAE